MSQEKSQQNSILNIVDTEPSTRKKWIRYIIIIALILILAWVIRGSIFGKNANTLNYVTATAIKGKLAVSVSASGQLQPINEIEVGSEASGLIETVFVDENDHVKRGQILVKLDTAKLIDAVTKSKAAVDSAKAQVAETQATVAESAANLARLQKVSELSGGKVPSKTEIESADAALLRAQANKTSASASVSQAVATLSSDETNLSKATIRSPINGIVLTRKIEPGQTVAATLSTPVLFKLAENLTQMELQVDVDEADVGQVKSGQPTFFTVDAWPNRQYPAEITRVGYGSQTKDNVVTYKTILKVSNNDLTLRPGMTATAEITTSLHNNVLLVPNEALRFTPPQTNLSGKKDGLASFLPDPPSDDKQVKTIVTNNSSQQVWILHDARPVAVPVKIGLTNGRYTEIMAGSLRSGMQVITDIKKQSK